VQTRTIRAGEIILPVLAAVVALSATPVRGDETGKVISSLIRDAKSDAEAAGKLVFAAKLLKDAPAMQVALCEKAYDLGIKKVAGFESVAAALDLLDRLAPQRAEDWQQKRLTFYRRRYALIRKDKRKHSEALVKMLLRTAERHAAGNEWGEASRLYRQALPVANTLLLGNRGEILERLRVAGACHAVWLRAKRFKTDLARNPNNAEARDKLIKLCLIDLDQPGEAAKYVNEDCDETLRAYLPLAARPVEELKEVACLDLGVWYKSLATGAPARDNKVRMYRRARGYLERFMAVHEAKDAAALKASLALKQVDAALARLETRAMPEGAVLVLTFDKETFFRRDGQTRVRDLSPKRHTGTVHGGGLAPGRAGPAMKFTGKTYVDMGNPPELQLVGSQTICMWINPANLSARQNPINKAYGGEGTWTLEPSGTINYYYGSSGGNASPYKSYNMPKPLKPGEWAHVAVVRDLKTRKVIWYRDGKPVYVGAAGHKPRASRNSLWIGGGYVRNFQGLLDEIALFGRALSSKEIAEIYAIGRRGRPLR